MLDLIMLGVKGTPANFCLESRTIWQFVGYILMVFKIVIPLLLIIWGMIDLGKAVISSKDDEIKKATTALTKRAIAGVVIFFIPTIVSVIFNLVDMESQWTICRDCITNPTDTTKCNPDSTPAPAASDTEG